MIEYLAARRGVDSEVIEDTMTIEQINLRYVLAKKDKHRELEAMAMMITGALMGAPPK